MIKCVEVNIAVVLLLRSVRIRTDGSEHRESRMKSDTWRPVAGIRRLENRRQARSRRRLPQANRAVAGLGSYQFAVRRERDTLQHACVSFDLADQPAGRKIPEPDGLVLTSTGDDSRARRSSDRQDAALVAPHWFQPGRFADIPSSDGPIEASAGQTLVG